MTKALDAAYPGWTVGQLQRAGIVAVGRYVAPLPNTKVIQKPEYDALIAGGIGVWLVWEMSADTALHAGYAGGFQHGREARRQARLLGHPDQCVIYQAVDTGALPSNAIRSYQDGFNDGGGVGIQGMYGDVAVGHDLLDSNRISLFWQTNATGWPGDSVDSPRAALWQRYNQVVPGISGSYDVNDVNAVDFGQNPRPVVLPPTPPPPPVTVDHGDKPVKTTDTTRKLDDHGRGYFDLPTVKNTDVLAFGVIGVPDPDQGWDKVHIPVVAFTLSSPQRTPRFVLTGGAPGQTVTVRVTHL